MNDLYKDPTTLDEIAKAVGKHKATIERWANDRGWISSEDASRGKHKKRYFALKDLPDEVREAIERKRHDDDVKQYAEELQAKAAVIETPQPEVETGKALAVTSTKAKALKQIKPES